MCGVTNPPVTPPPLTSARPTVDSQQETGQDRRTKEKGGGGRGVCGSVDHVFLVAREREMQEARGSKEKISPPPTRETRGNHRENAARGTHPPRGKKGHESQGKGKTRQGAPHQPRRKKESATRQRKNRRKSTKYLGVPRLVKGVQAGAGPKQRELVLAESLWGALPPQSRQHTKRNKSSNTRNSTILSSLSCRSSSCRRKNKSSGRCTPHPEGDPEKTRTRRQNKARSLKGSENHTIFPQSKTPKQEAKTKTFLPKHP